MFLFLIPKYSLYTSYAFSENHVIFWSKYVRSSFSNKFVHKTSNFDLNLEIDCLEWSRKVYILYAGEFGGLNLTKTFLWSDICPILSITPEVRENSIFVHMWSIIVAEKGVTLVAALKSSSYIDVANLFLMKSFRKC